MKYHFINNAFFYALLVSVCSCSNGSTLTDYVDPSIGTDYNGHTYPGAVLPFGMVSASPDTDTKGWAHCSGYHYADNSIMGFSQTHLSGTGANDMCDIMLMPVTGEPEFYPGPLDDPDKGYRSRFSHDSEIMRPGYYAVRLDDYDVFCEMTVTDRCSFYRFNYNNDEPAGVIFDMLHGNDNGVIDCNINYVGQNSIKGYRRSHGFVRDHVYYFYAEFSKPIVNYQGFYNDTILSANDSNSRMSKLYLQFESGNEILVKIGISSVSEEAAKANLKAEIDDWHFDKVVKQADNIWNDYLNKIKVESLNEEDAEIFYTALYHSLIVPNLITDVDGQYRGWNGQVHRNAGGELYTNYSLWDTYRAVHPLFNIICPDKNISFINSMLERYKQIGSLPINEYGGCETYCMIGYHAVPVIADAILQDMSGFDKELAYKAMVDIAQDEARGVGYYKEYGYIPTELDNNSVSKVLEYAFDDWCIAQVAEKLGKEEDAQYFKQRALNYRNVFDLESGGFVRGRYADGKWRTPFDPFRTSGLGHDDYTEGNAWQYTFYVPHDMTYYVGMNGGDDAFVAKLDTMFVTPLDLTANTVPDVSGLIGQYAHGNEPSHHVAYLYNFAGKPWKTQEIVSRIRKEMYSSAPDGLCGNDDCGQMSAWYIFSALGFYPVTPGSGYFVIGTPAVKRAEISLPNGNKFVIETSNYSSENIYIQNVMLNGIPYDKTFLTVEDIMNGATVKFTMGPEPNKSWGISSENRPIALIY